jgi:thymidylate kinase
MEMQIYPALKFYFNVVIEAVLKRINARENMGKEKQRKTFTEYWL